MENTSPIQEFRVKMGFSSTQGEEPHEMTASTPFRLFLASDLTPHLMHDAIWDGVTRLVKVDKYTFAELMMSWRPTISLEVPNYLDASPKTLSLTLTFDHIQGFQPDRLVEQLPLVKRFLGLRDAFLMVKRDQLSHQAFAGTIQTLGFGREEALHWSDRIRSVPDENALPSTPNSGGGLDNLLNLVDLGGTVTPQKPAGGDPMDALIRALAGQKAASPPKRPIEKGKSALQVALEEVEGKIAQQLDVVIHHTAYQQLESSWRGLKLLVDRLDFRKNIRLEVLSVNKEQLNTALYHQVLMPAYQTPPAVPFAALLLDYTFGDVAIDLDRLSDIAETAASLQIPVVASAATRLWTERDAYGHPRIPTILQHLQKPEFMGWPLLREQPSSGWIALALPHVLLRSPYRSMQLIGGLSYDEKTPSDGSGHLWGRASLPVGVGMAQGYIKYAWGTGFVGTGSAGEQQDYPIRKADTNSSPLSMWLDTHKQAEMTDAGFTVLASRPNSDRVYVAGAQVFQKVANYVDPDSRAEAQLHASLACKMVTGKITQAILFAQSGLKSGLSSEQIHVQLVRQLEKVLSEGGHVIAENTIKVEVGDSPRVTDHYGIGIWINSPASILGEEVRIALGFEVPK
ncbi:MAG: type VI secretion system contractile sheath large subunit [Bacteroidetes Order II. Incertae sedis bacterium]|nr:type VI secretion system contractile sheath large subunit [Bacteroidetes Order II. bacterium]